jgi:hypothetical protein
MPTVTHAVLCAFLHACLHPDIAAIVDAIDVPHMDADVMAFMRSIDVATPVSDSVTVSEEVVPGDPDLTVRVYRPRDELAGTSPCCTRSTGAGT